MAVRTEIGRTSPIIGSRMATFSQKARKTGKTFSSIGKPFPIRNIRAAVVGQPFGNARYRAIQKSLNWLEAEGNHQKVGIVFPQSGKIIERPKGMSWGDSMPRSGRKILSTDILIELFSRKA